MVMFTKIIPRNSISLVFCSEFYLFYVFEFTCGMQKSMSVFLPTTYFTHVFVRY
jgi:hypothetical protein